MFQITETSDLDGLQKMFMDNGVELSQETNVFVKCWEIRTQEEGRIAALRLEKRKNEFLIVGICVDSKFRKHGLGSLLINSAADEARRLNGKRVLLVAKVPGFFSRAGFTEIDPVEFEGVITCSDCGVYNSDCFPKFMSMSL